MREQLLVDAIAQARSIDVSEEEIVARVERLAEERGLDVARLRSAIGEGVPEALARAQLRDGKVLDFLAAAAKVEATTGS